MKLMERIGGPPAPTAAVEGDTGNQLSSNICLSDLGDERYLLRHRSGISGSFR